MPIPRLFAPMLLALPMLAATLSYTDGTFSPGDWLSVPANQPGFPNRYLPVIGSGYADVNQFSGSPYNSPSSVLGSSRVTNQVFSGDPVTGLFVVPHYNMVFAYDPSTQGAINSISFAYDRFDYTAGASNYGILILQNNQFFAALTTDTFDTGPTGFITWAPYSLPNLTPADFANYYIVPGAVLPGPGISAPDFSVNGSLMRFGYYSANSGSGQTISGIDNFNVTIDYTPAANPEAVPEPGTVASAALGLLALAWVKWGLTRRAARAMAPRGTGDRI